VLPGAGVGDWLGDGEGLWARDGLGDRDGAGTVDGAELAVRAVLGQQVSVAGARTVAGRLVGQIGRPLAHPVGSVTATFPSPEAIVADGAGALAMPTSRRAAIVAVAAALAEGAIDVEPGAEPGELRHGLLALPGIGPWTTEYVVLRALGDPDAFLPSDLGILRALAQLGGPGTAAGATGLAEGWRPWRAYAMAHLWAVPISRTTTTTKGKAA